MKIKTHILVYLISFTFVFNTLNVSSLGKSDSILLDCGSAISGHDTDGRLWESDEKFLTQSSKSVSAVAQAQDPSLPSTVPYMTSRVFNSELSYSFPVSSRSRYWVRLHFYPSSYTNLNISDSYFSVVSGGVTLLNNFSASITAQALTQAYIVKEYSLSPSPSGSINLDFIPSPKHNGSFAFVNGIEVISMPDLFEPAAMVGFSDHLIDPQNTNFQTMYRLNVGGQYIPPTNDSGLTRTWYDDSPYLYGAAFGVTSDDSNKVNVRFPVDMPKYIAPYDVYSTARSMGPDSKLNQNFNLTWVFQVDANYTYFVRLHFCELVQTKINQRVFDIYVNNQTAQESADVIGWAGSKGVPVYKDYAIYVNDGPGDEQIWVAIHPSVNMKPEVYDGILNGIEIFKLNDTTGNLAGPNPVPSPMLLEAAEEAKSFASPESDSRLLNGAAGGAAAFGLVAAICIVVYSKKRRDLGDESGWLPIYGNSSTSGGKSTTSGKSCTNSHISSSAASLCRHFTLSEIKQGTKNFDESNVIGVGGFGKVYKGVIDGGTKVAVKRSNPSSEQGVNEFQTEIEMLSKLRHRHLVSLIGYCEEGDEMILVYDYMAHGTLREHLYKGNNATLTWKQRLEICIGAARGLHYLHTGAKYTIIHRDVKTTNILVDENWVAKVSDFGLSKTGPTMNQNHVSTVVKGSFGYLDPEYFRRQQLTEKSDVYSFGVVLFEVLCARPALNPSLPKEQVSLGDWALSCQRKGLIEDIIDPQLKGKISPECLKKFAETAEKCLCDHGVQRPSMGDVLWNLEYALQLHENPGGEELVKEGNAKNETKNMAAIHLSNLSLGSESDLSEDSVNVNPEMIFTEMVNPKGR